MASRSKLFTVQSGEIDWSRTGVTWPGRRYSGFQPRHGIEAGDRLNQLLAVDDEGSKEITSSPAFGAIPPCPQIPPGPKRKRTRFSMTSPRFLVQFWSTRSSKAPRLLRDETV